MAMETSLNRVAEIVEMQVVSGGLADPASRLAVEKHKRRIAREWDVAVSKASECGKVEAAVRAEGKRLWKTEQEDARAEEAHLHQEEQVKV